MSRSPTRLAKLEAAHQARAAGCEPISSQCPTEFITRGLGRDHEEFQPEATAPRCPKCGGRHLWVLTVNLVTHESVAAEKPAAGASARSEDATWKR